MDGGDGEQVAKLGAHRITAFLIVLCPHVGTEPQLTIQLPGDHATCVRRPFPWIGEGKEVVLVFLVMLRRKHTSYEGLVQ